MFTHAKSCPISSIFKGLYGVHFRQKLKLFKKIKVIKKFIFLWSSSKRRKDKRCADGPILDYSPRVGLGGRQGRACQPK